MPKCVTGKLYLLFVLCLGCANGHLYIIADVSTHIVIGIFMNHIYQFQVNINNSVKLFQFIIVLNSYKFCKFTPLHIMTTLRENCVVQIVDSLWALYETWLREM